MSFNPFAKKTVTSKAIGAGGAVTVTQSAVAPPPSSDQTVSSGPVVSLVVDDGDDDLQLLLELEEETDDAVGVVADVTPAAGLPLTPSPFPATAAVVVTPSVPSNPIQVEEGGDDDADLLQMLADEEAAMGAAVSNEPLAAFPDDAPLLHVGGVDEEDDGADLLLALAEENGEGTATNVPATNTAVSVGEDALVAEDDGLLEELLMLDEEDGGTGAEEDEKDIVTGASSNLQHAPESSHAVEAIAQRSSHSSFSSLPAPTQLGPSVGAPTNSSSTGIYAPSVPVFAPFGSGSAAAAATTSSSARAGAVPKRTLLAVGGGGGSGGGLSAVGGGSGLAHHDEDGFGGDGDGGAPLPFAGRPFIVCPRSKVRYAPSSQRSVQNFLAKEFEALTTRQVPFREILAVNRAFGGPPTSANAALGAGAAVGGIGGSFSTAGVVVAKYYPKGGGSGGGGYSVTGASGGGDAGSGGASYGIVKLWDMRGTSLCTGNKSNNASILTVLVSGAAFASCFTRIVTGSYVVVMNPVLSVKKGGGGGGGGGDQQRQQMPMFRASELSSVIVAGRAIDCVQCAAMTNQQSQGQRGGGGFFGKKSAPSAHTHSSSSVDGGRQCTVLVNKAVSEFCAFHAAGAAGRVLRDALGGLSGAGNAAAKSSPSASAGTTLTTHTTGVTTARGLRLTMLPGGHFEGSGLAPPSASSSSSAVAMRVAGAVGSMAGMNPLLAAGSGPVMNRQLTGAAPLSSSSAAAAALTSRNVMLRPPTAAIAGSGGGGGGLSSSVAAALQARSASRVPSSSSSSGGAAAPSQSPAATLKQTLQAQMAGILGIGGGASSAPPSSAAGGAAAAAATPMRSTAAFPASAPSPLGTAGATMHLLTTVGDADPRSDETSPRGRWRAMQQQQQQQQQGAASSAPANRGVTGVPSLGQSQSQSQRSDSILSATENFICTKGSRLVNQTIQQRQLLGSAAAAASVGSVAAVNQQLLRHRTLPTTAMSGQISLSSIGGAGGGPSSDAAPPQHNTTALAQHSRIASHMTGLGAGGGQNISGGVGGDGSGGPTGSASSAVSATCPRGRMLLAAAVDAQTKAKMREQLEEAKRMSIVVKEASKRARGLDGDDEGAAASADPLTASSRFLVGAKKIRPELATAVADAAPPPPSSFFVRKDGVSAAAAANLLQQSALAAKQRAALRQGDADEQRNTHAHRQAAVLGLAPGVKVLAPGVSSGPSKAFSSLAGSGGSATMTGGGLASAGRNAQQALMATAGESAFVASALAVAARASGGAGSGGPATDIVAMAKAASSKHTDALQTADFEEKLAVVDKIVRVEKAIEAMEKVTEVPGVPCAYCSDCDAYFANSGSLQACQRGGHTVSRTTATRRFYECAVCEQYRIQVLEPSDDLGKAKAQSHSSITQGATAVISSNAKGGGSSGSAETRRRRIDRDCIICKRPGLWRRCGAAPAQKKIEVAE